MNKYVKNNKYVTRASSVKTYGKFQKSMSNVVDILSIDQISDSYKKLETAARDTGKLTTKTVSKSADAFSYMALANAPE